MSTTGSRVSLRDMTTRNRRLVLAAAVLVVGAVIALLIPFGTCPHGGTYRRFDGHSGCFTSDVGYAATSLVPLKFAIAVGAVVAAFALALTALVRRRLRATPSPGGIT
jgi:hypothetical protein